ncbi:MAG: hypothetical protein Unbinned579contig1003_24 [Prokaryotic dsDNA virus sp.]|nr:MAG: hypothetical protein Unbinned579contig1003_24 [Prokaryotic dsDNA virus sp.]
MEDYAIVFNGGVSEDTTISGEGKFQERWGWFGVMYRLTNGEIVNLERITKLKLLECLTWLSYETDLNEVKSVKRDVNNE